MYGFLWRIGIYEVIPLALNCVLALAVGIIFTVFPEDVQQYQINIRARRGRKGSWLARLNPFYESETRFIHTAAYLGFLKVMGYSCLLLSGIMTGFLVTYILRV